MKSSIRRFSFFTLAVAVGASAFGLFWSANARAFTVGGTGGTYCNANGNATMCYQNVTTVNDVPPATQSLNLSSGKYKCGACPTTGA